MFGHGLAPAAIVVRADVLDSREGFDGGKKIASADGRVVDLDEVDAAGALAAVGADVDSLAAYFDGRGDVADLQADIVQVNTLERGDDDVSLLIRFEPRVSDTKTVTAGDETGEDECARCVRGKLADLLREIIGELDRGADDHRAGLVG